MASRITRRPELSSWACRRAVEGFHASRFTHHVSRARYGWRPVSPEVTFSSQFRFRDRRT